MIIPSNLGQNKLAHFQISGCFNLQEYPWKIHVNAIFTASKEVFLMSFERGNLKEETSNHICKPRQTED